MAILLSLSALPAQEMPDAEMTESIGIFPLALVLEAAGLTGEEYNKGNDNFWRPDWPLELPPDSFMVRNGKLSEAAVFGDGVSLVLRYDPEGRVEEFPFMLNGNIVRVSLMYRGGLEIHAMDLSFESEEDVYRFEFLEYLDSYPSLVRASYGELWCFVSLSKRGNVIMETWYDEEGIALGAYAFSLIKIGENTRISAVRDYSNRDGFVEYFYDSRNLLTESSGFNGVFKVLYFLEDLPRYWERRPANSNGAGNFALQWDENGFLLRITADTYPADTYPADSRVDYRYEYTVDERGNWIERREIRMISRFGLLVPSPGTTFTRVLEYN